MQPVRTYFPRFFAFSFAFGCLWLPSAAFKVAMDGRVLCGLKSLQEELVQPGSALTATVRQARGCHSVQGPVRPCKAT